jgi:hypothetical protein
VERLFHGGKWSLVYADEVAAVFVRAQGNEQAIARAVSLSDRYNRATRAWLERPIPKIHFPGGRIEGTRSFARLLATIGDGDGAAEQYSRLFELGIPEPEEIEIRLLMAKYFSESGRADRAKKELERILTIDPGNRDAQERLRARSVGPAEGRR